MSTAEQISCDEFMIVSEVAEHYRVSRQAVIRWIRDGRLPAINIGTPKKPEYRIYKRSIENVIISRHNVQANVGMQITKYIK